MPATDQNVLTLPILSVPPFEGFEEDALREYLDLLRGELMEWVGLLRDEIAEDVNVTNITINGITLGDLTGILKVASGALAGDADFSDLDDAVHNHSSDAEGGTDLSGITAFTAANNLDIGAFELRAQTFQSDVAGGTAPLVVASNTLVSNLNADKADGYDFDQALLVASSPTFADVTATDDITVGDQINFQNGAVLQEDTDGYLTVEAAVSRVYWDMGATDGLGFYVRNGNTAGTGAYSRWHYYNGGHRQWCAGGHNGATTRYGISSAGDMSSIEWYVDTSGNTVQVGAISAAADTDTTHVFGRMKVYCAADGFYIGHYDWDEADATYLIGRTSDGNVGICSASSDRTISMCLHRVGDVLDYQWSNVAYYPMTDNIYDLGTASLAWQDIYYYTLNDVGGMSFAETDVLDRLRNFIPRGRRGNLRKKQHNKAFEHIGVLREEVDPSTMPPELTGYASAKRKYDLGKSDFNPDEHPDEIGICTNQLAMFNYEALRRLLLKVDALEARLAA